VPAGMLGHLSWVPGLWGVGALCHRFVTCRAVNSAGLRPVVLSLVATCTGVDTNRCGRGVPETCTLSSG
jgi:hypothetical protein